MFLALPLILISCQKTPIASFSIDNGETVVGQPVFFTNTSHNSDRFEWDFGDGYTSNESDPAHTFTSTGSFEVKMTAFAKGGHSDETRLTLNIVIPTLLEVEVREYYTEDVVPGASIILYPTIADWDAQTNSVAEGIADGDGVAVFSNLDQVIYYADVWEATHDNYQLRTEDVAFVTTPEIIPHKINRFIAWVDVAVHTKGTARGSRDFIIKKLERKATDKRQPATDSGTENWQELYNRRVNK